MLGEFGFWGFQTGGSALMKILLGIGIPLLAVAVWGTFIAPNSKRHLQGTGYLVVKVVLFGLAAAALIIAGQRVAGIVLAAVFIIITILLYIWE